MKPTPLGVANQRMARRGNGQIANVVVGQPPPALAIGPVPAVETYGPRLRSEPNDTVFPGRHCREIVQRQAVAAGVESPGPVLPADALRAGKP